MKHLIALGFFLVTWNQYTLKTTEPCQKACDGPNCWNYSIECVDGDIYTVEVSTFSKKLEKQKDVDLFVGWQDKVDPKETGMILVERHRGIISSDAFNVKVEEIKK